MPLGCIYQRGNGARSGGGGRGGREGTWRGAENGLPPPCRCVPARRARGEKHALRQTPCAQQRSPNGWGGGGGWTGPTRPHGGGRVPLIVTHPDPLAGGVGRFAGASRRGTGPASANRQALRMRVHVHRVEFLHPRNIYSTVAYDSAASWINPTRGLRTRAPPDPRPPRRPPSLSPTPRPTQHVGRVTSLPAPARSNTRASVEDGHRADVRPVRWEQT